MTKNCPVLFSDYSKSGFELAISKSWFADWICLFGDHFKQFLWNLQINSPSVGIFAFRETTKFLFTLQAPQIAYYLTPKSVKLYTIFLHLDSILAPNPNQSGEGGLQHSPIPSNCWNFSLNLSESLLKR